MSDDLKLDEDLYRVIRRKWYFAEVNRISERAFALRPIDGEDSVNEGALSLYRSSRQSAQETLAGWSRAGIAAIASRAFEADFDISGETEGAHVSMMPRVTDHRGQVPFEVRSKLAAAARVVIRP